MTPILPGNPARRPPWPASGWMLVLFLCAFPPSSLASSFDGVLTTPHNFLPPTETPSGRRVCIACHAGGGPYRAAAFSAAPVAPTDAPAEPPSQAEPVWQKGAPAFTVGRDDQRFVHGPGGNSADCLGCHDGVLAKEVHQVGSPESPLRDHPYNTPYPRRADGQFRPRNPTVNQYRYWSIPDLTSEGFVLPTGPQSTRLTLPPATALPDLASLQTVRTVDGMVHCDSCHNPHDNHSAPFLRAPAKDLCLICHDR